MLKVTQNRKSKYVSLGINIHPNLWDTKKNKTKLIAVVFKRKNNSDTDGTVNGTVNENEQNVLNLIRKEEGVNAIEISERISESLRMTKRHLKSLNDKKLIEFRGAPKTGGYFPKTNTL